MLDALGDTEASSTPGAFRLSDPSLNPSDLLPLDVETQALLRTELVESGPTFLDRLDNLHNLLERYRLHFGYRVIYEIATFVSLARERVGSDPTTLGPGW